MVVHLWGKFWMAAWRGGRLLTWMTGVISFAVSIAAAFTGYLLQTNFESQWIAFEAKDALNAAGIGAWFNVADVGQMFMWHVTLLPLAVGAIVALHVCSSGCRGRARPSTLRKPTHSSCSPTDEREPMTPQPNMSWRTGTTSPADRGPAPTANTTSSRN